MRFYVLVSGQIESFDQCISMLPNDKVQVVINTTNKSMIPELKERCEHYNVPYIITESDGTPATGKNSLLKCFLDSEDEYAVCIDGDDIITPTGVEYYQEVAKQEDAPDLLCLYKQVAVRTLRAKTFMKVGTKEDDYPQECYPKYPMTKSLGDVCFMSEKELEEFLEFQSVPEEKSSHWARERWIFQQIMNNYSEDFEYMTRMVFWSRKAAELAHYENDLIIGEDTVQFMRLKKLANEGKLRMFRKRDGMGAVPTYVQNEFTQGICQVFTVDWEWTTPLNRKIEKMIENGEMPRPTRVLPDYRITT